MLLHLRAPTEIQADFVNTIDIYYHKIVARHRLRIDADIAQGVPKLNSKPNLLQTGRCEESTSPFLSSQRFRQDIFPKEISNLILTYTRCKGTLACSITTHSWQSIYPP